MKKLCRKNPTSYTHAIMCPCPYASHGHAYMPDVCMSMSMLISPHIPSPCSKEHFKKKKMFYRFFLIEISYFILLHMPCHHLGFMHVTSSKVLPHYYLRCALVVPYLFTVVSSLFGHMFVCKRNHRHVALFL